MRQTEHETILQVHICGRKAAGIESTAYAVTPRPRRLHCCLPIHNGGIDRANEFAISSNNILESVKVKGPRRPSPSTGKLGICMKSAVTHSNIVDTLLLFLQSRESLPASLPSSRIKSLEMLLSRPILLSSGSHRACVGPQAVEDHVLTTCRSKLSWRSVELRMSSPRQVELGTGFPG